MRRNPQRPRTAGGAFAPGGPWNSFFEKRLAFGEKLWYNTAVIRDVKEHLIQMSEEIEMKENIHPKYEKCIIRCACGEVVETRSTKGGEIRVEVCSKCHPFFTGKQKFVDAGGRVDKFKKRLEAVRK